MTLKSIVTSYVTSKVFSAQRLQKKRMQSERSRKRAGRAHIVDYFHQTDDPYSHLAVQTLARLASAYPVELRCHLVGPPPDWAAPERAALIDYSRSDAERLAAKAGLHFQDPGHQPAREAVAHAESILGALLATGQPQDFVARASEISQALWRGEEMVGPTLSSDRVEALKAEGNAHRERLGHYLGGVLAYGGELYWGVDRLAHLEDRLRDLTGANVPHIYRQPETPSTSDRLAHLEGEELHFYLSFRSPYTYIAAARAKALSDAYGCALKLRFVLPMVMRGLPVPRTKGLYIMSDVAREARRLGVPFGQVCDPVGKPVEQGYSLLPWARDAGRGYAYSQSFLSSVWSGGVDAGSDRGLRKIVERAGLDWAEARQIVGNEDWRDEAETNRAEMTELGIWGVPSFRVGNVVTWGQDRLWVIEDELKRLARAKEPEKKPDMV